MPTPATGSWTRRTLHTNRKIVPTPENVKEIPDPQTILDQVRSNHH